ncbi:4'-phosphopantetheinyl transferase sfp [Pontiella desulfatans]|uniref:4'-phosphopantetheinyl transferase sfp n=1 Tax=Pontiella desulfatans TaxID=2750659 RepID=A0A6C2U4T3_PONDE|nr:4'-phosphopantetheinyl transferase superfamily protein [Pontiella desulfatans]VGO14839.1 4'-phosphopantetheinyl transferase sfp [Pontiella desulfatans]
METIEDIGQLPELDNDTIHIWGVHVPGVLDRLEALQAGLCVAEREKAARFLRESDRQSSIASRGALRVLLSVYTGVPSNEIAFGYSDNGKPYLEYGAGFPACAGQAGKPAPHSKCPPSEVAFNVSHSGEWVVLAFGRNRQIGVDVEKIRREMDVMAIASRYFTPEECAGIEGAEDIHAAFFHYWSRKEAYIKACGSALFRELSTFAVPCEDGEKGGWHFRRLDAGSNYASAVVSDRPLGNLPCYDFSLLEWRM